MKRTKPRMFQNYNWTVHGWTGEAEQMEWQKSKCASRAQLASFGSVKKRKGWTVENWEIWSSWDTIAGYGRDLSVSRGSYWRIQGKLQEQWAQLRLRRGKEGRAIEKKNKSEGTHWQGWGKWEKRWRKLEGSKRRRQLCRHQEGDAVAWSREMGETCWRRLPEIANKMDEMWEKGRGAGSCGSQLRQDKVLPSTKRGSWTERVRKLSSGNKNKRDTVNFTFLLTGNGKISGKVLYKVKHLCVCECYLWVWTEGHQGDLWRGCFSLIETLCR